MDLKSAPYKVTDFSEQVPNASFAAMRFDPLVFTMTIVEDLGVEMDVDQYAGIIETTTRTNFRNGKLETGIDRVGEITIDGVDAVMLAFTGSTNGTQASYIVTTFVKGTLAYQLTVFASGTATPELRAEAERLASAFSFLGDAPVRDDVVKMVDAYTSDPFGYRLSADPESWFPWADLHDDYPFADTGALGGKGYGAAILPFCWTGAPPTQLAMLDVFMERFGEDYPSDFITAEKPVSRDGLSGLHLAGQDFAGDDMYSYHFWVVSNDSCAYAVSAWGPADLDDTDADLMAFWDDFTAAGSPTVFEPDANMEDKVRNAFFLNQAGMHYYEARSNREAFRFLSQAADLDPLEPTYLLNGLRALSDLNAYQEAYDWLHERIERHPGHQVVRSWDAWLSFQIGEIETATKMYAALFRDGYREDDEFGIYLGLLADEQKWDEIDATFDAYADGNLTDKLRRLKASLLSRRGSYVEALQILESMSEGRPFNAELAYAKIEVFDAMENAAGILEQADLLVEHKYESLDSWFYKGYAEYMLRSYVKSRESFEQAQKYSPTNTVVQEYIAAINGILGEGDNASISEEVDAVALPKDMKKRMAKTSLDSSREGFGAYYIDRVLGYDYDGSDFVVR
ncbi:MAG: hypothetical protein KJO82_02765, partial [Gammaproteobacteria bacterium]|nr:hypothetical protein [Gammaproteobacteria bacterium]